jgi:hypothetical protein
MLGFQFGGRVFSAIAVVTASALLLMNPGATADTNQRPTPRDVSSGWWDAAFKNVRGVERFWDFGNAAGADGKGDPIYVMLGFGDSFGSGEGAWDTPNSNTYLYDGGTFTNHIANNCHLSTKSAFYLHVENLRETYGRDFVGANFACTGAESMHIVGSNIEACRDKIVDSSWRVRGRQIGGVRGGEGKRGLCSSLPGPGGTQGFSTETDARWTDERSRWNLVARSSEWRHCLEPRNEWDIGCLVLLQGIRSPGANVSEFFNFLAGNSDKSGGAEDIFPNDAYQSQLYYADRWLQALRDKSSRPVVVVGSYVSAGGNDKGFGPAVTAALHPFAPWDVLEEDGFGALSDDEDDLNKARELRNLMYQPSITFQLEATYRLLEQYMRDWNDRQFVAGSSWRAGEVVDPFIAIQEYPDKTTDECNSSGSAWMDNMTSEEADWLDSWLTQPVLRDIRNAADRLRNEGVRIEAIPANFQGHGPCESNDRWINTPEDALAAGQIDIPNGWQGDIGFQMSKAAIHPNERGHLAFFVSGRTTVENLVAGGVNSVRSATGAGTLAFQDSCLKPIGSSSATDVSDLTNRYNNGSKFVGKVFLGQKQLGTRFEPASDKNQWSADPVIRDAISANDAFERGYAPVVSNRATWPRGARWMDLLISPQDYSRNVQLVAGGLDFSHVPAAAFGSALGREANGVNFVRQTRLPVPIISQWGAQAMPSDLSEFHRQSDDEGVLEVTVLEGCASEQGAVVTIAEPGNGQFLKSRGVPIGGVPWEIGPSDGTLKSDYLWYLSSGVSSGSKQIRTYPASNNSQISRWPLLVPWHEVLQAQPSGNFPALTLENGREKVWDNLGVASQGSRLCPSQPDYSRLLRGPYTLALSMKNGKEAGENSGFHTAFELPWLRGDRADTLAGAALSHLQPSWSCITPARPSQGFVPQKQAWAMRCDQASYAQSGGFNPCRVESLFRNSR